MQKTTGFWIRIGLINLSLVALMGALMRYKIGFEFPYFNQKFIQEAHSHFAFAGWITHILFVLIVALFRSNLGHVRERLYNTLILINLVSAYGMLVSFFIQGYGFVSITFATLSIANGYVFSFFALLETAKLSAKHPAKNWLKAAIWFGILSTAGTIVLSHMMATKQYDQTTYLGSIYFYLHFQYNGWFLFACIGLWLDRVKFFNLHPVNVKYAFWLFFLAGIPTFFLSTLWARLPGWLYMVIVLASILQLIGWLFFIRMMHDNRSLFRLHFPRPVRNLFLIVGLALTLKLLLQLGSTIPEVSHLAFGFRPIVIAYLHLALLLIVSLFLLTFSFGQGLLHVRSIIPISLFTIGILLNEGLLAIQGIASFSYTVIPFINEMLFGAAIFMLINVAWLVIMNIRMASSAKRLPGE